MIGEGPHVDARLTEIALSHHTDDLAWPAVVDVTEANPSLVTAIRHLPLITLREVDANLPPRTATGADLCVPVGVAPRLVRAIERNPIASVTLVKLINATHTLPISDALALESTAYSLLQSGAEYRAWLSTRTPSIPEDSNAPRIAVTHTDDVITITIDRPAAANALDARARHELVDALTVAACTELPVLLRGRGKHFSAGGDLDEFTAHEDVAATHLSRLRLALPAAAAAVADRITASVQGGVIGAGLELSAFAERLIAQPDTRFRLPEVRMGLLPGCGGTVSVPRRIGPNRALVLMLSGSILNATDALTWGLIDEVTKS